MAESFPAEPSSADPDRWGTGNGPPRAMRVLFLIVLIDLFGFGVVIPLLYFYGEKFNATPVQVTNLFTIFSAAQFIAAPIFGMISDRWGRRGVLFFSQLGGAASYLMLGIVSQMEWSNPSTGLMLVYVSRALGGLAGGNISTAQAYVSDITTGEQRARGMGLLGAAFGIGFTLGPVIGGTLGHFGLAWPAYAGAMFSLVASIYTWLYLPETRVHKPAEDEVWLHPSRFRVVLRRSGRGAGLVLLQLLLIGFVSMSAFVMMESVVGMYLADTFGFRALGVGLTFGLAGLVIIAVQGGLIGRITKAVGEWPPAILGPFLVAVGLLFYIAAGYMMLIPVLVVGILLNSAGRSLQQPTLTSLISKHSDPNEQGTVFGLYHGLASSARAAAPYIAGVVYAHHHVTPFIVASALVFLVSLWTLQLRLVNGAQTAHATDNVSVAGRI